MALYSFSHSKINAQEAGKTFARLAYICRHDAVLIGERHQLENLDRASLKGFAAAREALAGKNGRVAECFIAALPREGTREQHQQIVQAFADRLTRDEAPWIAALHYDKPGNPHVHLLAFDQPMRTAPARGRPPKVIVMSRKGALEEVRAWWAEHHNRVMAGVGPPIDHRSLADQGKAHLLPTVHEGPKLRAMKAKNRPPTSRPKPGKWRETVDWPSIDEDRDRMGLNQQITQLNALTTTYLEEHHGRPDGILAALAREDGQITAAGAIDLAQGPGGGKAHPGAARDDARDAGGSDQAPAHRGTATSPTTIGPTTTGGLAGRMAALLGLDGPGGDGRGRLGWKRRGVAVVGRYASGRLRRVENTLRRLIAETGRGLARGLRALIGPTPALSAWRPAHPAPSPPRTPHPQTPPRRPPRSREFQR